MPRPRLETAQVLGDCSGPATQDSRDVEFRAACRLEGDALRPVVFAATLRRIF